MLTHGETAARAAHVPDAEGPRPASRGTQQAILALLRAAHAGEGPPPSLADWCWRYERNPAPSRAWIAEHAGRIAAHYGSLSHRTRVDGQDLRFAEVVDVCLDPAVREPALLRGTARRLLAAACTPEEDLVVYRFDRQGSWELADPELRFQLVRSQLVLARDVPDGVLDAPAEVEAIERFDEQALWLFDRCVGDFGAATVRDAAYLNWRFCEHPRHRYVALGVRDEEGILAGYAVLLRADRGALLVVDWLVPSDAPEVGELLVRAILAHGRPLEARSVRLIVPEWSPWFRRFQEQGFLALPSEQVVIARSALPHRDMYWLRDTWWYQWSDWHVAPVRSLPGKTS